MNEQEKTLLSLDFIRQQEQSIISKTYQTLRGWCDFASSAIDVLLKLIYFTDEYDVNTEEGKYKLYCWLHFERIAYTFRATYNLCLTGYYPEAAILLRTIMETFVKMKYLRNHKELSEKSWGLDRFPVSYKKMFDEVAPGCHKQYAFLCGFSHSSGAGIVSRTRKKGIKPVLKQGLEYDENDATFIMNQFSPYLLAHLHFIAQVFPEILRNLDAQLLLAYQTNIQELTRNLVVQKQGWRERVRELIYS